MPAPWTIVALMLLHVPPVEDEIGSRKAPAVVVAHGPIEGRWISGEPAVRAFLGVPFAAPPVGDLRWRATQPVEPWTTLRRCTEFGPACPQPDSVMRTAGTPLGSMSEDCLYLNVWSPEPRGSHALPVMVWIHGGGFIAGSASQGLYDGAALARKGIVMVSLNYRLGPFGFLSHPELSKESPGGGSGNYGLQDQIAALRWVRDNITVFGGDPQCVTVFGESAGAFSIGFLMVSPAAKGLFHRAIAQSGAAIWSTLRARGPGLFTEAMEQQGEKILAELAGTGDDLLARARAVSADEILLVTRPSLSVLEDSGTYRFAPMVDGEVIPDDPARLFESGSFHRVPVLQGTNADEGSVFTMSSVLQTPQQFEQAVRRLYGDQAELLLKSYPVPDAAAVRSALRRMIGDSWFVAPTRAQLRAVVECEQQVYRYQFTHVLDGPLMRALGSFHALEIPFVFGTLANSTWKYGPADQQLSDTMMQYWVNFAGTGNPNGPGLVEWPAYDPEQEFHLEIDRTPEVAQGLDTEICEVWEKVLEMRSRGTMDTRVELEGLLEGGWAGIGGEHTGWILHLKPEGMVEVDMLALGDAAAEFHEKNVRLLGTWQVRHYLERGDTRVLVAERITEQS